VERGKSIFHIKVVIP